MIENASIMAFARLCGEVSEGHISVEMGKKYARVVIQRSGSTSVFCFLDLANGDILKAESWQRPHKTPRGNIHAEDGGRSAITKYGAVYIR